MKKILGLVVALTVLALGTNVFAAAFTAGNIVIYRVGNGTQTLTNTGNSVFLDEFTQAGTWVQSIMMPTNWYGANAPLITSGDGFAQGAITLSEDGRFILLTGFGATLGQFTNLSLLSTFASNEVPRVVGLVDGLGNINTTTAQTNTLAEEEIRSAASTDGTNLWFSGAGTGIKATTRGSLVSTQVEKVVTNVRDLNIYTNQLFFTASTGIRNTTNFALPTTTNALVAILPGTATNNTAPFGFAFFNLGGGASNDTLYVTDGTVTFSGEGAGVVTKYSLIGGTWVNSGSIGAGNATGLAGFSDNAGVHLFITSGGTATPNGSGTLYPFIDKTGFNGNVGTNAGGHDANLTGVTLVPNGLSDNTSFNARGVAMVPQGGESPTNAVFNNVPSVGPAYGMNSVGSFGGPFFPSNFTYSVANFGTASFNYQFISGSASWLTAVPQSGTITPGGSLTVVISVNGSATNLNAGLHSGSPTFHLGSGVVSRPATLQVNAFTITPSTNFTATGPAGGPFVPSSQIYVLSNATANPLNWTVNTTQPWSTLSATTGSLGGAASTNIIYSINNAANSLAIGPYADSITFSNASGSALLTAIGVNLQVGFGIFDDYSTYVQNANIVGQNGWVALDNPDVSPLQVAGGVLSIPRSCVNGEEPDKTWSPTAVRTNSTGGGVLYAGMLVTVSTAEITASPPYAFSALVGIGVNNPSFLRDAGSPVANGGGYVWGARQATDTGWVFSTTTRTFGVQYMVIDAGDLLGTNCWIFVNPLASSTNVNLSARDNVNLFTMTPDCVNSNGDGEDTSPQGVGGWIWGQFGASTCQAGLTVSKFAMSTNYTDVYKFLAGAAPPPTDPFTLWQQQYFTVGELGTPSFSGPGADPFGKGISNTNQFLAGFNPTNASAYVHITSISKTNGGTDVRVDYLGASGDSSRTPPLASRTNVLEFTTGTGDGSYATNSFAGIQTNILSGGVGLGTATSFVETNGATFTPSRYYRVRVLVP